MYRKYTDEQIAESFALSLTMLSKEVLAVAEAAMTSVREPVTAARIGRLIEAIRALRDPLPPPPVEGE